MRLKRLSQVAALAAAATLVLCTLVSCQGAAPEDPEGPPAPEKVAFQGKPDPKFVGAWKSAKGDSTLDLGKDGTLNSETVAQTAGGKSDVKVTGQWLIDADKLKLSYQDKTNNQVVMQYTTKLSGDKLELAIPNTRIKTTYSRSSR